MAGVLKLEIAETVEELKTLLAKQTTARGRERIQALYLLKIGQVKTLKELGILLGRDTATIYRWFQKYKADGLQGMLAVKKGQGRKPAIPKPVMERLKERLQEPDSFNSYSEVRTWLKKEFGIEASYKVVHEAVRYKLKLKLKSSKKKRNKKNK
ncbi:helix-turn-helix domain-containing protein [Phormidium sp. CCY1219]|uniref:helix-turn-helix domain-containing protein n=1 Tax=Phormidium sp. CCY1219 TaxID=2886104 RepID=UPI002D1ED78C|nr:helix-turn-helix domain-containing protein [Phormidium sp. CCY1219]MEB3830534.1 helix-turn-helix domain-containing protein [Phormidium sp. CCY1219]